MSQPPKQREPFKRTWVKCPICEEPDMPAVWQSGPEDGPYVTCLNLSCPSNNVEGNIHVGRG